MVYDWEQGEPETGKIDADIAHPCRVTRTIHFLPGQGDGDTEGTGRAPHFSTAG
jgi:hypothetical protein